MHILTLDTHSPEETESIGRLIIRAVPPGSVIALHGDLAAGKTCLTRGMAAELAVEGPVSSPTFTLVNEYEGDRITLYHLDLYRLDTQEAVAGLGMEELFDPVGGITVIEWAERAEGLLPANHLQIHLNYVDDTTRRLTIQSPWELPGLISSS